MRRDKKTGIRNGLFIAFLLFTGMLLALLWLFEIVFLDEFYNWQTLHSLRESSDSLVRNIDNVNLQVLADRIAEQRHVCVLITDENMDKVLEAEGWNGCIIHHMSTNDLKRHTTAFEEDDEMVVSEFPLMGFRNRRYDARKFKGRVPPSDTGEGRAMITVERVATSDGRTLYVFLNTLITPVDATVQTIRNELYFISILLVVLSFLMSLFMSRRITRPLVETTANAAALSRAQYQPVSDPRYTEIEKLNQQLVQAAHDLRRVEEMQNELIANISHDLRTPLTLIEGYAEVMRDLPDENNAENMQVIIDETRRLTTLVNSVLELNTARSGLDAPRLGTVNLTACIRDILCRYAKLTEQEGYQIRFEPSADVCVEADEVKLQQVIYNLINNAITYTGEDKTVWVRQLRRGEKVRIEIADSGEGIAPEELPHIWERYYRGHKPHKRAAVGSGLGLSIVKSILDAHDLPFGAESTVGEGTTFWFELPVTDENA
ncbi:MAG: HAMP domain-containing sensor histidine kinase [bacterium]|nr:HAMP domain-containing sensor histidine kinase [bacterium]